MICIPGSDRYSDYRKQLCERGRNRKDLASYGERAGIPVDARTFISNPKGSFVKSSPISADDGFPTNEYLRIEGGEAVLKRLRRKPDRRYDTIRTSMQGSFRNWGWQL